MISLIYIGTCTLIHFTMTSEMNLGRFVITWGSIWPFVSAGIFWSGIGSEVFKIPEKFKLVSLIYGWFPQQIYRYMYCDSFPYDLRIWHWDYHSMWGHCGWGASPLKSSRKFNFCCLFMDDFLQIYRYMYCRSLHFDLKNWHWDSLWGYIYCGKVVKVLYFSKRLKD